MFSLMMVVNNNSSMMIRRSQLQQSSSKVQSLAAVLDSMDIDTSQFRCSVDRPTPGETESTQCLEL